ncbi:MAG: hypothetical protein P8Y94_07355, partial [Acidobacteriota bacterium]
RTSPPFVDATTDRPTRRVVFNNAHLIEGVTILPEGDLALVTLVKPKNLLPVLHVERGWTMSNGIGVIDLKSGRATQLLLDEANRFFADPFGVVSTPDGRLAFVSHSGVDQISVIDMAALRRLLRGMDDQARQQAGLRLDLSTQFVIKRIPTAANPKGMVVAPDGKRLYVAERLNDSILAIDTASLEPLYRIELQGKERETPRRRGEKLFNSGLRSFQGQFSCQSCHPRNQTDRLQYDFEPDGLGLGVVDNRSLLGIRDTAPYKWNGKNTSLFMQCGIRFSRILTRVDSFRSDELSDLVSFIRSLPDPPNPYRSPDGKLTPSQARGKLLYERTGARRDLDPLQRQGHAWCPPRYDESGSERPGGVFEDLLVRRRVAVRIGTTFGSLRRRNEKQSADDHHGGLVGRGRVRGRPPAQRSARLGRGAGPRISSCIGTVSDAGCNDDPERRSATGDRPSGRSRVGEFHCFGRASLQ